VDNPAGAETEASLAIATLTSKSLVLTVLPGASCNELVQYVEYVPRLVPRAPRSTNKRVHVDDASASPSATNKPCPPSTRPGTKVIGIMPLGEHVYVPYFSLIFLFVSLLESSFLFRWQCSGDS
jgi:hypothetical protein